VPRPPPAGLTISDSPQQNRAALVFNRFAGRYMVGALSFSLILGIGPIPTRAVPWFTRRPGHQSIMIFSVSLSSLKSCVAPE